MLGGVFRFLLRKVISFPIKRRLAAFKRATERPAAVQAELLARILRRQGDTAFGRDHHFDTIRDAVGFRKNVPLAPYEYLEPYMARVRRGEVSALLANDRVLMFALTSGTTAARKFIPVTEQYLADYRRGWNLWGLKVYRDHLPTFFRPIVQLAGDADEMRAESGVPCGAVSGLTATAQMRIIRRLYSVPPQTGRIKDAFARYYVALRFSLPKQAGLLLAANPSTIVALARTAEAQAESLLRDLHDGTLRSDLDIPDDLRATLMPGLSACPERVRELESLIRRDHRLSLGAAWPSERLLIGTWTGGSVGQYVRQLRHWFGDTPVRDLGLIASEGRMTLPWEDGTPSGVLDVTSHYFEFIPETEADRPNPIVLAAHELEEGQNYFIVPTTAYGLYRYQISDLIRVTGFYNRTPLVQFLNKGSRFANLTGEKLSEHHVTEAMTSLFTRLGLDLPVYTVAPIWDDHCPYYGLFIERGELSSDSQRGRILSSLDQELCERNVEYASKRESGRLGLVRMLVLPPGTWANWDRQRLKNCGGAAEQYKHPCLIGDPDFRNELPVEQELSAGPNLAAG